MTPLSRRDRRRAIAALQLSKGTHPFETHLTIERVAAALRREREEASTAANKWTIERVCDLLIDGKLSIPRARRKAGK